jgi:hypothetical protein
MKNPKLILIGAGPGDPSLITVKGAEALKKADVVLYDALVHPELLTHTKKSVVKIFVGKRAGKESMEQQEINQLAVESAFGFGTVVRRKQFNRINCIATNSINNKRYQRWLLGNYRQHQRKKIIGRFKGCRKN